ncbi:MAG: OmpA family protein [Sphingobacteriales bacterium]|nr:MAG: OmpA family protein [Sphingobacteriales bacterium]
MEITIFKDYFTFKSATMKTSNHILTIILAFLISLLHFTSEVLAQNDDYGWRLGAGVGVMSYYGDLSSNSIGKAFKQHYKINKNRDLSYSIFLERRISPGIGIQLSGNKGFLTESDRNRATSDAFYDRALNFRSEINEGNLSFIFKADNDKILGKKVFLAPYLVLGAGITHFQVFADLKDKDGSYYNYSQAVINDGTYETDITNIGTEKTDNYATVVPHLNAGVGLRFRLSDHFSLHVQSDFRYVFSDYLDDVSSTVFRSSYINETQAFAGKPNPQYDGIRGKENNLNDIYAISSASFRISFGQKKETFLPPVFYARQVENTGTETVQLLPTELKVGSETIVVYDTIKVIEKGYTATYDSSGIGQTKALLDSLKQVQLNNQQLESQLQQAQTEFSQLQQTLTDAQNSQDTLLIAKQDVILNKMDSLQKSVTNLYIVSAVSDQKALPQDSTATDAKYTAELKQLKDEIDRLKAGQFADKRPSLNPSGFPVQATVPPLANMPAVSQMPSEKNIKQTPSLTSPDNQAMLKIETEMDGLKMQIAMLTNAVNAQTLALSRQATAMPPVTQPQVIIQQPSPIGESSNQQWESSLNAINNQLFLLNSRISSLEQRPPATTIIAAPATNQQSANSIPADSTNHQSLIKTIEDLQKQLHLLNNKVLELEKQPVIQKSPVVPTPVTNNPPITEPKAVVAPPTPPPVKTVEPVVPLPTTSSRPEVTAAYKTEVDKMGSVSLFFEVNSAVISDPELTKLQRVVDIIRRYPEARITINGYTDSTGSAEYNKKLSEKRANAVLDRLINGYKVNPAQVILKGFGDANAMPGASSYDRRVDLHWEK